jgi:hypothetical protein
VENKKIIFIRILLKVNKNKKKKIFLGLFFSLIKIIILILKIINDEEMEIF